jgi:hypothetical protein
MKAYNEGIDKGSTIPQNNSVLNKLTIKKNLISFLLIKFFSFLIPVIKRLE